MRWFVNLGMCSALFFLAAPLAAQEAEVTRDLIGQAERRERVERESAKPEEQKRTALRAVDLAARRGVDWLAREQCVGCHFQVPKPGAAFDTKGDKLYTVGHGHLAQMRASQSGDKTSVVQVLCSRDAEKKEAVTYLGVSLAAVPAVVRRHVAIPAEMGLLVETVDSGSPAETAGLKQHDLLVKIDEQYLVNPEQFSVLIRTYKPEAEVRLSAVQQSEQVVLKARLAQREMASAGLALTTLALVNSKLTAEDQKVVAASNFLVESQRFRSLAIAPAQPSVPQRNKSIAYLGIQTVAPSEALAKQLKLAPGTGLMIESVEEGTAAAQGGLKAFDVLQKLDDQILVNSEQFTVLIRAHKAGDEVRLTLIREGKRQVFPVALGQREIAVMSDEALDEFEARLTRSNPHNIWEWKQPHAAWARWTTALSGNEGTPDAHFQRRVYLDILGVLPRTDEVKAFVQDARQDKRRRLIDELIARPEGISRASGSTAVKWSDSEHTLTLISKEGNRHLTVLDTNGNTLFDGPVGTDEQKRGVPHDVAKKLALTLRLEAEREAHAAGSQDALARVLPQVEFSEVPLKRVFEELREQAGVNLVVNWKALKQAGVNADEPISLSLKDVRLSTALNTLLSLASDDKAHLAFTVEGEVILVSLR